MDHAFWYLSRAAGLTAYLLLALSVCLGLLVRTRIMDWLAARWRWFDLHQFTALLALAFVLLHVFSLLGDHYIGFTMDQLLIPFASPYRTVSVAGGVIALYLMLVVVATFWVRRLIGYRAWRAIHYVTFTLFILSLLHGLFSGSDTGELWTTALYWGSGMLVGALTIWRFTTVSEARQPAAATVIARSPRTRELEHTLR
ncbi:MAG TPA: ferric reductase-like transmembrane domain-containing protein [Dehalococcoidia bacterium]|nr:ferric reductase-like transmembrane domain-containing protein [Dehalococcoidia bacterium]